MSINISEEAYEYIKENEGEIYIYTNSLRGCCGGQAAVDMAPQIEPGAPVKAEIENYQKINYKDITIYLAEKLDRGILETDKIILKTAFGGAFKKLKFDR